MKWSPLLKKFRKLRVLVVGDVCLDRWCRYDPDAAEPSRETGIPRTGIVETIVTPGAGGTVANNLSSLGAARVAVMGAIGQDGFGFELERALTHRRIDYSLLVATPEIQTFTYTKVINSETGIEDKARVDFINNGPLPSDAEDQLIAQFSSVYEDFDAIVVSDQAETDEGGVVTTALREVINDVAERRPEMPVVVDSRRRIGYFRGVIAKPNQDEADAACQSLFGQKDYERLRQEIGAKPLVVTQGEDGALLITDDGATHVSGPETGEAIDVCGAGDAFAAGMALATAAGAEPAQAVQLGVVAAGITVMKPGTGTATPEEVLAAIDTMSHDEL